MDKVKIGGIVYKIEWVDRLQADDLSALNGQIDYDKTLIQVDTRLNSQKRMQTVLHEIVHAIFHQIGRGDQSEELINSTAYSILQVLRDNPAIMDAIKELDNA